jgi:hypothetical protein
VEGGLCSSAEFAVSVSCGEGPKLSVGVNFRFVRITVYRLHTGWLLTNKALMDVDKRTVQRKPFFKLAAARKQRPDNTAKFRFPLKNISNSTESDRTAGRAALSCKPLYIRSSLETRRCDTLSTGVEIVRHSPSHVDFGATLDKDTLLISAQKIQRWWRSRLRNKNSNRE